MSETEQLEEIQVLTLCADCLSAEATIAGICNWCLRQRELENEALFALEV